MPLDRDQFKTFIDMLLPHVNTTPEDRRVLVDRALHGSQVITPMVCSCRWRNWNGAQNG
jgi:hypothetical protein